jgi:predicted TIM-barrel fold metal-dependent hydrolase
MHASWSSDADIFEFLAPGWAEYFAVHVPGDWHDYFLGVGPRPKSPLRGSPIEVAREYRNPFGDRSGAADVVGLREHLDASGTDHALLYPDPRVIPAAAIPTVKLAIEATRAINDWMFQRWITADSRLRGLVLVPTQVPAEAAAEIQRWAAHEQAGGVLLAAGGLAKPFGHPVYGPIHEAAHEAGLPIVLMAGGNATIDSGVYPAAGGFPGTYAELRTLAHQSLQSHVASLIALGVLRRFPSLRFLVLGGGILWVTPWLWRLDANYKAFRHDVAWAGDHPPSQIFKQHFLVGTHPFGHRAPPDALQRYLLADPELADVVCFASGFPDSGSYSSDAVAAALPAEWRQKVLSENAERLLGHTTALTGP